MWLPLYRVTGDKLFCLCIVVGIVCPTYFVARCVSLMPCASRLSDAVCIALGIGPVLMPRASRFCDAVCIALGIGPSFDAVCIAFV